MKIIALEHERCSEYDKTTYYAAPDGITEDEVRTIVDEAQDAYLKVVQAMAAKPFSKQRPITDALRIVTDESVTVKELKARHQAYEDERNAWELLEHQEATTFEDILAKAGIITLGCFEGDDKIKMTISWGHRHGSKLSY